MIVSEPLSQLAFCWRLERKDGAGLGLTSHDRALVIDGDRYDPVPGITPHAITLASGLDPDDGEVSGALTGRGLAPRDLESGLWNGASARLFAVDWESPEAGKIDLMGGALGEIHSKDGAFEAALVGPAAKLEQAAAPETQPSCRADFGDAKCRIDLAARRREVALLSTNGADLTVDHALGAGFRFGRVAVLDGESRGFKSVILAVNGTTLTLRDFPRAAQEVGTRLRVEEGCDKMFATCRDRFSNAANFRGEPHVPGRDILTRYPGA